jgi:tetratricopeptide (TPR) repeat protein
MLQNPKIHALLFSFVSLAFLAPTYGFATNIEFCQQAEQTLNANRPADAIPLFNQCVEQGGLSGDMLAMAHIDRGIAYRRSGKLDEASKDLSQALKITPQNADALAERGMIWVLKNDLNEALKDFSAAVQADPKLIKAVANRGLIYELLGQPEKAVADFKTAYALGSRAPMLLSKLVQYGAAPKQTTYNISLALPDGFKLAFKDQNDKSQTLQYVPDDQNIKNWEQMITITIGKLDQPVPNVEKLMTQSIINSYQAHCGSAHPAHVKLPSKGLPFDAAAAFCDNVDQSKVPANIHAKKNGFLLVKSYSTPQTVYSFQYEWQSDENPSSFVKSSGLLKDFVIPLMTSASVTISQ